MAEPADFAQEALPDGSQSLRFSGTLAIAAIGRLDERLRELPASISSIDLSAIEHIDTVGAWLIYRTARDHDAEIIGADKDAQKLINAVSGVDAQPLVATPKTSRIGRLFGEVGEAVVEAATTFVEFIGFIGQIVKAIFELILHPRRFRIHAVVQHFDMVGVRALGIIGLMSFLIGIVIAQQGAVQLRQFGAEVFTVNLVGRLTFRELGILMTAIMVAGPVWFGLCRTDRDDEDHRRDRRDADHRRCADRGAGDSALARHRHHDAAAWHLCIDCRDYRRRAFVLGRC